MKKLDKIKFLEDIEKKIEKLHKKIAKLTEQKESILVNCNMCHHQDMRVTVAHNNDPYCGGYDYDVVHYWCTLNLKNEDGLCHRFKKKKTM